MKAFASVAAVVAATAVFVMATPNAANAGDGGAVAAGAAGGLVGGFVAGVGSSWTSVLRTRSGLCRDATPAIQLLLDTWATLLGWLAWRVGIPSRSGVRLGA